MDAQATVAHNVRRLRLLRGLSQEAFAVDAEIDRTYVGRLERGSENPSVAVLARIAHALGVEIAALFAPLDPNEPQPQPLKTGPKSRTV